MQNALFPHIFLLILCSPFHFSFLCFSLLLTWVFSPSLYCYFDMYAVCVCGQMTAGRCHTLLSPVTEESGEEGTNSEVSSPPACRSPSPGANADAPLYQVLHSPPALAAPASFCNPNIYFGHKSSLTAPSRPAPSSIFISHQPNIKRPYFKDVCVHWHYSWLKVNSLNWN